METLHVHETPSGEGRQRFLTAHHQTRNHQVFGITQFGATQLYAYNHLLERWLYFSDMLKEWCLILPEDPRFRDDILFILEQDLIPNY